MGKPRRFTVGGPFLVVTRGAARSRSLDRQATAEMWKGEAAGWGEGKGCYVFALRRARGYVPLYVGQTARDFQRECFTDRNYRLLHEAMDGEVGTLVLFLLKYENTRGRSNKKSIAALEQYLVELALDKNPKLKNRVYTNTDPGFAIRGVHRERGRPPGPAVELKRVLGL